MLQRNNFLYSFFLWVSSVTVYKTRFLCPYHYVRFLLITDTSGFDKDEPTSFDIGGRIDKSGLGFRNWDRQSK